MFLLISFPILVLHSAGVLAMDRRPSQFCGRGSTGNRRTATTTVNLPSPYYVRSPSVAPHRPTMNLFPPIFPGTHYHAQSAVSALRFRLPEFANSIPRDTPESPVPDEDNNVTLYYHSTQPQNHYGTTTVGSRHGDMEGQLLVILQQMERVLNGPIEVASAGFSELRDLITEYSYYHHRMATYHRSMPYNNRTFYSLFKRAVIFDLHGMQFLGSYKDMRNLGEIIGEPHLSNSAAFQQIIAADLVVIPFCHTYKGSDKHMTLAVVTGGSVYHFDSSGEEFKEPWLQFVDCLEALPGNNCFRGALQDWRNPVQMFHENIQTKVVTLELACGVIVIYLASAVVKAFCLWKLRGSDCVDSAVRQFHNLWKRMQLAEQDHDDEEKPKSLHEELVAGAGLGVFRNEWSVARYKGTS
ncbi:uncharacterized protein LOC129590038 isoform X2 [Paramacrobiotus metropolitanus]|uniref:uncharacterized protein LOC129590038 isoform X2 n=1 Tax=Paramacrobiotus metropolitanus TaxID=2943436 RepID=UPI002445DBD1|nr:uncharacterized protein LOC129590038 isoform X2 [Paramacrobiotus metropolitanus]